VNTKTKWRSTYRLQEAGLVVVIVLLGLGLTVGGLGSTS
jgi:hypothetical protein